MLFNSFEFLLVFLPISLFGFFAFGRIAGHSVALIWIICASLVFHGYTRASFTWILIVSIAVNYAFGLCCNSRQPWFGDRLRLAAVVSGIAFNLLLLGYFKYAGFFASTLWSASGIFVNVGSIVLPLAISFYTFQQIAYLVDSYKGRAERYSFLQYASYLAFFPHLIAGPIVRHEDLVRQLSTPDILSPKIANIASGIAIIMIGLFKKVVFADTAAGYVDPIFQASADGVSIGFVEAWLAALLFSFVIYFDFSGYSDMAIGLARLFNVKFPENFASPFKATSIIDFWRRWHITLSSFLRDYLYIPLGGRESRYRNLLLTMVLGGLWHGAAWTFVVWGALHGLYLVIAHLWRDWRGWEAAGGGMSALIASRALTFLAVVVAWVLFRSSSMDQAAIIYSGMIGVHGFTSEIALPEGLLGNSYLSALGLAGALLLIVNALPNTQQFVRLFRPVIYSRSDRVVGWARTLVWRLRVPDVALVVMLGVYAMSQLERVQPFIYFRF